ncbi:MAG: hypothetical protein FD189_1303 [Elusimicrobia bacterium]|nr:MAG: hypothetical protein FD154_1527 [Elusimicrobiota bacterium]KAF0155710.1 MAG: hypothetical protein FD189_1303 [Elusimicrobiota bacterium]
MSAIIINGIPWDKLHGRTVNNARFYLKNRRFRPPEGYSYERLAFFICALEPLFELCFAPQHFEGEYSVWVERTLGALPGEAQLTLPPESAIKEFMTSVADAPAVEAFLACRVPDIPMDGYVGLAGYRSLRKKLASGEIVPFGGQRGATLLNALRRHELKFPSGGEFRLWKEFLTLPGRPGEDLREAFIEGGYQYNFAATEFKDFVFGVPDCPGLNAGQLALIYNSVLLRSSVFLGDEDSRRLADVFAGPLASYAADYAGRPRDVDLISLFALEDPAQMKELAKNIAGDLESGWKDFFYVGGYGEAEARDFEGFDQKLDASVSFIRSQYRKAESLPDLWEDRYFKFLYLMCALWFKSRWEKISPAPRHNAVGSALYDLQRKTGQ